MSRDLGEISTCRMRAPRSSRPSTCLLTLTLALDPNPSPSPRPRSRPGQAIYLRACAGAPLLSLHAWLELCHVAILPDPAVYLPLPDAAALTAAGTPAPSQAGGRAGGHGRGQGRGQGGGRAGSLGGGGVHAASRPAVRLTESQAHISIDLPRSP